MKLRKLSGVSSCVLLAGLRVLISRPAATTSVVPMSMEETIRAAHVTISGRVLDHQSSWGDGTRRWMKTDFRVLVEEVLQSNETIRKGSTITLSFWRGNLKPGFV